MQIIVSFTVISLWCEVTAYYTCLENITRQNSVQYFKFGINYTIINLKKYITINYQLVISEKRK